MTRSIYSLAALLVILASCHRICSASSVDDLVTHDEIDENKAPLTQQDQPQQANDDRENEKDVPSALIVNERSPKAARILNPTFGGRSYQIKRQQYWSKCQHSPLTCLLRK